MEGLNRILYTGSGGGKTSTALGLALRAIGHKKRVVMVQFMKGRKDIGEYLAKDHLPGFVMRQFGRKEFVNLENPSPTDRELAKEGLAYVRELFHGDEVVDMLILDEINLAVSIGLLDLNEVLSLLSFIPPKTIVILTGRNAPKELVDLSDYVVEMRDLKRPGKTIPPREGIEY